MYHRTDCHTVTVWLVLKFDMPFTTSFNLVFLPGPVSISLLTPSRNFLLFHHRLLSLCLRSGKLLWERYIWNINTSHLLRKLSSGVWLLAPSWTSTRGRKWGGFHLSFSTYINCSLVYSGAWNLTLSCFLQGTPNAFLLFQILPSQEFVFFPFSSWTRLFTNRVASRLSSINIFFPLTPNISSTS